MLGSLKRGPGTALDKLDKSLFYSCWREKRYKIIINITLLSILVWAIVAIAVIAITAHNMTSDTTSMSANILVGIFLATLVYMMFGWLIKKFT